MLIKEVGLMYRYESKDTGKVKGNEALRCRIGQLGPRAKSRQSE